MLILWISVLVAISAIGCNADEDHSRASIQMFGYEHVCGCQILTRNVVLTSAECAKSATPREYKIHVGHRHGSRHEHTVSKVIVHPAFNPETNVNNIAILVLSKPIDFSVEEARTIDICKKPPNNNAEVEITGWTEIIDSGKNPEDQTKDEINKQPTLSIKNIKTAFVNIVPIDVCDERYGGEQNLTKVICAESPGKGNYCHGDAGGPLVAKETITGATSECLAGITSMGYLCPLSPTPDNPNPATFPAIYTDVTKYIEWINKIINFETDPKAALNAIRQKKQGRKG